MKYHPLVLFLILIFSFTGCTQTDVQNAESAFRVVETGEFQEKMNQVDAQIIDVRTDAEVKEGMLPGAVQMDVEDWDSFEKQIQTLNPDKPVLIYCRSGNRSNRAGKYLVKNGFKEVYDLKGGIIDWRNNKGEIVKP